MKYPALRVILAVATAILTLPIPAVHASNVTLTKSDASGTSSFAAAGNWSNGQAPSAANTYQTAFILRAAATATFQGSSLEILSGGDLRIKTSAMAATINNLILDNGGIVDLSVASGQAASLLGKASISSGQAYLSAGANEVLTVNSVLSGAGGIISWSSASTGAGTVALAGANTYTGLTTIPAGTLQLTASGSLAAASSVSLAAGATFDVSAQSTYTLGSSATLSASGSTSAATIKGGTTVSLGSRPVALTYDGSHAALTLSAGALQLNNNIFTVVVPGTALTAGTYTLVTTTKAISGTPNATPSFAGGNGIAVGDTGTVSVSGDNVILTVTGGGGGSGSASAAHSTLSPGLVSLTANGGSTQVLTVQARDTNNVNLTSGGATVVFAASGAGTVGATTDHNNGTYTATLTAPSSAGLGTITATLNGTSVGTLVGASQIAATYFSSNFGDPVPGLTTSDTTNFNNGSVAFNKVQTVASGLGPIYNNSGCANCHNFPVSAGSGTATVTRFGEFTNGVFNPLTSQGGSLLQDNSTTTNFEVVPPNANVTAKRITQHMFGIGLVEAIAESTIESNAAVANPDGIVGTVAFVTDLVDGKQHVGRFGWKAQHATLLSFTADAANNEVGITSRIEPVGQAPNGNTTLYNKLNTVADPNDNIDGTGKADIDRDADFQRLLGPPPTLPLTANAVAGQALFSQIHCDACHTPSLPTSANFIPVSDLAIVTNHVITALSSKMVPLYSDLLLHNMGSLADGIAQAAANTNQMRTAPLWGLRESLPYLHDGRALSVDAAIRAHAGDGAISATRYINLSTNQQAQVVDFLNSL
jgi:autotransporter-associated beta strand protein